MGVHTGEPVVTEEGYVGMDVHRAARIAAVGHGGQVLVSQSTRDLVPDERLRDLGAHRLKDLTAAERIYQLGEAEFPPLRSLDRTNLPIAATPLVGRRKELAELVGLLRAGARLVTVTGAGGGGKTRLALQAAAELADDFEDGVVFVPLASLDDPALVTASISQHAGLRDVDDLRRLELLLVLDNLEHLLGAADDIGSLLMNAPGVTVLVTSRTRLHVSAEHEFELEPFSREEAVEFFLLRAGTVKRGLQQDDAVTEICRRLDGLPLALELAASRVKLLEPVRLLERLDRSLPVLTGGARDAPERQRTLAATIEWSYALLDGPAQEVFRNLSVFGGSFALDDAESVAQAGLDEVATLVDWSLLKPTGNGRFFMLATIREYAGELLHASGAFDAVSGDTSLASSISSRKRSPCSPGRTSASGSTASRWSRRTFARRSATRVTRETASAHWPWPGTTGATGICTRRSTRPTTGTAGRLRRAVRSPSGSAQERCSGGRTSPRRETRRRMPARSFRRRPTSSEPLARRGGSSSRSRTLRWRRPR